MNINDILNQDAPASEIINALRDKSVNVPNWSKLRKEYDPSEHPVMRDPSYRDQVVGNSVEKVTRITYDLQRLAVKRMSELVCGIPVKRIYKPENDQQAEVAKYLEAIFRRNRIDSVNVERTNMLFAGCEVLTLWYAVEDHNNTYGFESQNKIRVRNFSPMLGDNLYPLMDEYGDMVAMSIGYTRKSLKNTVEYFDTYTADRHIKWANQGNKESEWVMVEDETITLGKIPCVYVHRPTPIWENTSRIVYEMEWAMSRNGNYLRKNSKPLFVVYADEQINYGNEKSEKSEFRTVLQYPKGSTAQYVTWTQAVENLKFYVDELRQSFFTQLQLPDWSYENMKSTPMSGESRKQLFIDCQLKVKDESGRLLEFFDREINVVKAHLKACLPPSLHADVDALQVEVVITPFTMTDAQDKANYLLAANGGKPLMSHRESIEAFGASSDVDTTMAEIAEDEKKDVMEPYE